jgi:mono/diheme cytochrome c family protein
VVWPRWRNQPRDGSAAHSSAIAYLGRTGEYVYPQTWRLLLGESKVCPETPSIVMTKQSAGRGHPGHGAGSQLAECGWAAITVVFGLLCLSRPAECTDLPQQLGLHGAREIYQAACAGCHGQNGEGAPQSIAGFVPPDSFPHFNKCDETTPEYTRDYKAVIRDGGPARGFSQIMPSFSGVLTSQQMDELVAYLRSFCNEKHWPVGELNVPRALKTEKAFPESETVLSTSINTRGPPGISNELDYEHVLGKRDQFEAAIPFSWMQRDGGGLHGGLGDLVFGLKHVLFANLNAGATRPVYDATGSILSVQGEVSLPTGDAAQGFGNGSTSFGAFAAYDQLLPLQGFIQVQAGTELPVHTTYAAHSVYLRTAFGKSFNQGMGLGRQWTPMVELLANRDLRPGATTDWDVVPEFQITLSRRQHVRAGLGYDVPLNDTAGRSTQVMMYLLWDWFDGGLLEGW